MAVEYTDPELRTRRLKIEDNYEKSPVALLPCGTRYAFADSREYLNYRCPHRPLR